MNVFIAVVVLLAVAISLAAAGVAWLVTTYYSMMWRPEVLKVLEVDLYYNTTDGSWWLRVEAINKGEADAEVYKVEVHSVEVLTLSPPKVVKAGSRGGIYVKLSGSYTPETTYTIRLYLRSGTVYPVLERVVRASA